MAVEAIVRVSVLDRLYQRTHPDRIHIPGWKFSANGVPDEKYLLSRYMDQCGIIRMRGFCLKDTYRDISRIQDHLSFILHVGRDHDHRAAIRIFLTGTVSDRKEPVCPFCPDPFCRVPKIPGGDFVGDRQALDRMHPEGVIPVPVRKDRNRRKGEPFLLQRFIKFFNMSVQERDAFFAREDVNKYLDEVRSAIREKRALTNVGLTIPEVFMGLIRENLIDYSKLYKYVDVRRINGEGRAVIMGSIPEAVWTECCANLNELTLGFNDVELDCYKLGGYFAVCNANMEDSAISLATELVIALSKAIGLALDKAILYGTGVKMPLGVVSRLAQTEAPATYPATARTWVDLHTSNIKSIPANTTGAALIAAIITAFGNAKGKYSRGTKVWVMNELTYTNLVAASVSVDASGAIVAGVNGQMPVIGGNIEVLDFIPDNVIIGGYFDLYLLAERAGAKFMTSEHVRFLQDQTVIKANARYDGVPAIAEAFVAIGLNAVTPNATMSFAADTAN